MTSFPLQEKGDLMRDRFFREDENELPYLVNEKRDPIKQTGTVKQFELDFRDIPYSEFSSYVQRLALPQEHKRNLIGRIEIRPKNCTFSIHQRSDEIRITFTVENEYVKAKINVEYNLNSSQVEFLGGTTYHDSLEAMQWFKNAVRKIENETGYKFLFCYNGPDFTSRGGKLLVTDDFETMVMFEKDHYSDHYGYQVDFAKRNLEFYHEYPFHEFYAFFG